MKRIMVIGCPGSGKSTFSRKLHEKTGIPLCHLDLLNWNPDKTTVPQALFIQRQKHAIAQETWIIDGNYGSTMELRLAACDTVFLLDYATDICLEGVRNRMGKSRRDMPWEEHEEDPEFISFIQSFRRENLPKILELLSQYPEKEIHIFKTRDEAHRCLESLVASPRPLR